MGVYIHICTVTYSFLYEYTRAQGKGMCTWARRPMCTYTSVYSWRWKGVYTDMYVHMHKGKDDASCAFASMDVDLR